MKKRIATLLTLALSTTLLLGGCGGSSDTETTNNDSGNSSGGFLSEVTDSKSDTLSEVLSTGKVIAYKVDSVDKSETPDTLYFFDNGKVTIIPGEEFGLTMGDFSQMTDEAIWEKYKSVRESYASTYKNEKYSNIDFSGRYQSIENELELVNQLKDIVSENRAYNDWYNHAFKELHTAIENGRSERFWLSKSNILGRVEETYILTDEYTNEEIADFNNYLDKSITRLNKYNEYLKKLEEVGSSAYKAPFFELPFSFILITDGSGNNLANELLVYPTKEYDVIDMPSKYYNVLTFANVDGIDRQIYDTTYHCFGLGKGEEILCTRESMTLDTLDSENVLIDLNEDEINELFKEEVLSRYE